MMTLAPTRKIGKFTPLTVEALIPMAVVDCGLGLELVQQSRGGRGRGQARQGDTCTLPAHSLACM